MGALALDRPQIIDKQAHERFCQGVAERGWRADDPWIGGYVDYEWCNGRHYVEAFAGDIRGRSALEFGCNVGATAIMLARLGAHVSAVDIDHRLIDIARLNAARYGATDIDFRLAEVGSPLPFAEQFDLVICNSVLEYVAPPLLGRTLADIERLIAPGGLLLVLGTSNRLWPKEVHSQAWSNYIPSALDGRSKRQRGIFPWQITRSFTDYRDCVAEDGGFSYFEARRKVGDSSAKLRVLKALACAGRVAGLSAGEVTPSFFLALRKPSAQR